MSQIPERRLSETVLPWIRFAVYPIIAAVLVLLPLLWSDTARPDPSAPDSAFDFVNGYHLVGPILAIGLLTVAAFRFRSRHRRVGTLGGAAGVTVGLAGAICLAVAVIIPVAMPERSSSWIVGLVLQVVGVLALGAAMMVATSRRERPPEVKDAAAFKFPADDTTRVEYFEREVTAEARQLRQTSRRWGATNYVLGFLTATLSGAAGVTGMSTSPNTLELIFAILAIVGAGLAALNTSLGAAQAQKEAKVKAMALETLSRNIRWAPRERTVTRIDEYVDHLNRVTGPDWPPAHTERSPGAAPPPRPKPTI